MTIDRWDRIRRYRFNGDVDTHRQRAEALAAKFDSLESVKTQVWEPAGKVALDIRYPEHLWKEEVAAFPYMFDEDAQLDCEWSAPSN